MKKSGMSRRAFLTVNPDIIEGTDGVSPIETKAGTWYLILKKGENSELPEDVPLNIPFRSPADGTQFKLVEGDQLIEFHFEKFCKTNANFELGQGSVDTGDDCDPGAKIRDGITTISGSLEGFLVFDDKTEQLIDVSQKILNLFLPYIEDDGKGGYSFNPPSDFRIYLGLLLNEDAKDSSIENWLVTPIIIPSLSLPGGNTEAQSMSISWEKGEGLAVSYNVPRAA